MDGAGNQVPAPPAEVPANGQCNGHGSAAQSTRPSLQKGRFNVGGREAEAQLQNGANGSAPANGNLLGKRDFAVAPVAAPATGTAPQGSSGGMPPQMPMPVAPAPARPAPAAGSTGTLSPNNSHPNVAGAGGARRHFDVRPGTGVRPGSAGARGTAAQAMPNVWRPEHLPALQQRLEWLATEWRGQQALVHALLHHGQRSRGSVAGGTAGGVAGLAGA